MRRSAIDTPFAPLSDLFTYDVARDGKREKTPMTRPHEYGNIESVKTTLEIPDTVFRRAKSKAAEQGKPLRQFVTETVEDKLKAAPAGGQKPWMKHIGKLKDLRKETERINRVIEESFEDIDPEVWSSETRD
jgi:hypothetical protein